jgi:hypothetical protein
MSISPSHTVRILLDIGRGTEVTVDLRSLLRALLASIPCPPHDGDPTFVPNVWANGDAALITVRRVQKDAPVVEPLALGFFCQNASCGVWNQDCLAGGKIPRLACRVCDIDRPLLADGTNAVIPRPPDAP